jgi:hypothetical protein
MHPFLIDGKGSLFVDLGSATNACQEENRVAGSLGLAPCTEKEMRGGTWLYDANKTGQVFSPSQRYASGIRNGEGFAFDAAGRLFVTQHGRDQLFQNWPRLYTAEQSAALPAEELSNSRPGPTTDGPNAIMINCKRSSCLLPNMAAMEAKRWASARSGAAPWPLFPATGRPTTWRSIMAPNSRQGIEVARSSPSTDPGIERPLPSKDITSCSNRWLMGRRRVPLWSSRMALPVQTKTRAKRRSGQPALLKAPMARCTSPMTFTAGFGASPTTAIDQTKSPRRRPRQSWLQTSHPRPSRPKENILMRVGLLACFRYRQGPAPSKWHSEIGYSMATRATAHAAAAADPMLAEALKGRPSTAAIGFGVTEAWPR